MNVTPQHRTTGEVWMQLTDAGRKRLAKLMVIQDVSTRGLSREVGWASHTILVRLLSGQQSTLTPDKAAAIAAYLGVGMDDLFVPRMSSVSGRSVKARSTRKAAA